MRVMGRVHWLAAGLIATALHVAALVDSETSFHGDVSPPTGPAIESAASLAGIVGAPVEIEADDVSEEMVEATTEAVTETHAPREVEPEPATDAVEVENTQAEATAEVTGADPPEVTSQSALSISESAVDAPAVPSVDELKEHREAEEIAPQLARPAAAPLPIQEIEPPEPPKAKPARNRPKQSSRKAAAAPRGNADRGSAGPSAGGREGRSTASAGAISSYAAQVRARILARRPYADGTQGTTVINFGLSSTGRLRYASVSRSSGNRTLDARALAAVRGTSFPAPPNGALSGQLQFSIPFHFR